MQPNTTDFNSKLRDFIENQNFSSAIDHCLALHQTNPSPSLSFQLGTLYFLTHNYKACIQFLTPIPYFKNIDHATLYNALGMSYYHLNQFDLAIDFLKKYYQFTPLKYDAMIKLALAFRHGNLPPYAHVKLNAVLVNREKQFIICKTNKVGATSICHWFWNNYFGDIPSIDTTLLNYSLLVINHPYLLKSDPSLLHSPNYKKYIFVRNPWERLVSLYVNKVAIESGCSLFLQEYNERITTQYAQLIENAFSFQQFVDFIYESITNLNDSLPLFLDPHLIPQIYGFETIEFEKVYPFPDLTSGLRDLSDEYHLSFKPTIKKNTSKYNHLLTKNVSQWFPKQFTESGFPNYRFFYNDDLINKVAYIYKADIDRFHFTFESQHPFGKVN